MPPRWPPVRPDGLRSGSRTRVPIAEVVLVIDGVEHRISGDPDRQIVRHDAVRAVARHAGGLRRLLGQVAGPAVVPWRRAGRRGRLRAGADRDPAHRTDARRDAGARVRGLARRGRRDGRLRRGAGRPACRPPAAAWSKAVSRSSSMRFAPATSTPAGATAPAPSSGSCPGRCSPARESLRAGLSPSGRMAAEPKWRNGRRDGLKHR